MIALQNLRFRYPKAAAACIEVAQFEVQAGERIFLYGPSGSGKSTLLGLLAGVLVAEQGLLSVFGHNLSLLNQSQRDCLRADNIGYIFQQFNLIPYLSVFENVVLPCHFSELRLSRALAHGHSLQNEAERLLSHLDLHPSLWHKPVTDLSVGQQQRVAAARALIGKPALMIADEPTSALDADRQHAFLELLLSECIDAESTLIFVSHNRSLAASFSRELDLSVINQAHHQVNS